MIHFYELGQSKRGASLRISLTDIIASNLWPFLDRYPPYPVIESPSAASTSSSEGDCFSSSSEKVKYEVYVPAPADLGRDEAFRYHLTTRNVFAWMFGIPIVGNQLGEALISLLDRMNGYRFDMQKNQNDVLLYLDNQGYTDFRDCPDHSLAVLQFAGKFQHRELWTDAFVHCVGMNDELMSSAEFEVILSVVQLKWN